MPDVIRIVAPPEDRFAAGLIERRISASDGEAEIERQLARGDVGHCTVPNDLAVFILIKAEVDEAADEVAGL